MFQEECRSQILCEHIGVVFRCGNGVNFNLAFLDLFSDIMVAYLNMLNPFLGYGILSIEDSSMTVTIDRDIQDRFPKFSEKNFDHAQSHAQSESAMYSAVVEDVDIRVCVLECHLTLPFARVK